MKRKYWLFSLFIITVVSLVARGLMGPLFFKTTNQPTTLLFVGDIMLSRSIEKIIIRESNPLFPFLRISDVTNGADITFGNLEGPVSIQGSDQGSVYSFRAHPSSLKGLVFGGFDIVSVANNHIFDWGVDAFDDTLDHLGDSSILYVGGGKNWSDAKTIKKIIRNNETFCFLGYSEFSNSSTNPSYPGPIVLGIDEQKIIEDIARARAQNCDAVVVSFHWGNEYETRSASWQKKLARTLIDNGAVLIIGHHPHVVQEVERYNKGLIAYSLGNFVFDQNFSQDTRTGLILKVSLLKGEIESFREVPIVFSDGFQPYVSSE